MGREHCHRTMLRVAPYLFLMTAVTSARAVDTNVTIDVAPLGTCSLYEIKDATCGQSDLDCKYTNEAKAFEKGLQDGTCASQGYTKETSTTTKSYPIVGKITITEYTKPSAASALFPNAHNESKPTLDSVIVCNKDHPSLKMSFGSDTVYIQSSDSNIGHFDCTVKYSIAYHGDAPWIEGALQLPDEICGQKLHQRVKIHSSFEKLDFITGGTWGPSTTLKRGMKDGIDHCGTCPCDDCHYDCTWPTVVQLTHDPGLGNFTSLLGPQHRRRSTPPPPIPKSCTCHGETPIGTLTRRRQFQSRL